MKTSRAISSAVAHALEVPNANAVIFLSAKYGRTVTDVLKSVLGSLGQFGVGTHVSVRSTETSAVIDFTHTDCVSKQRISIIRASADHHVRGHEPSKMVIDRAIEWPVRIAALQSVGRNPNCDREIEYF